ncbi:MAG TPA: YfhO family protein [Anaerolineae bacterium]|nr:YfhO family protein [Anaerolineae bacterium]
MRRRWAAYSSQILAAVLLALLCALFFWRIITPVAEDRGYFPSGDFVDQFYVFSVFEARQLLSGHLPLWNPYAYGGHPFLADIQSAIFYPPSLLTILLSAPWGFPLYALELEAIAHVFLAGLFTYLFARRLLRSNFPALVVAVTFSFGGYLTSYPIQQLAILEVDVWLPLILLLLSIAWERWQERGERRGFVWAGLAFGVSLLAGHPQSSMYVFYVAVLYWGFETYRGRGSVWSKVGLFCLFVLTGLGVAAVQLIPSLEYMLLSTRAAGTYEEMAHGFPLHDLLQILLPGVLSQWSPLYVGVLPLLLACAGVFLIRDRRVLFWAVLAVAALLLSLGGSTFLYSPFYLFAPGFGIFRSQERLAYVFSFAVAILAGYGAAQVFGSWPGFVRERLRSFNRGLVVLAVGALGLVFAFLYGWSRAGLAVDSPFGPMLNRAVLLTILTVFAAGCIFARQRGLLGSRALMTITVLVVLFDLFTVNWQNNLQSTSPLGEYGPRALLAPVQAHQGAGRVYNEWRLPGNYGMFYEVEDIGGASPLRLRWYDELAKAVPEERLWELMNVKCAITWRGTLVPVTDVLYQEPGGEGTTYLHRLQRYLPRAWVVHRAQVGRGNEALRLLATGEFDPLQTVLLEEEPQAILSGETDVRDSSVTVVEYEPSRITLDVDAAEDGMLVLSEVYYPGWRARVDGREVRIHRVDHALRGVRLERGSHRVEFVYGPVSLKVGLLVTVVVLCLSGGMALLTTVGQRVPRAR